MPHRLLTLIATLLFLPSCALLGSDLEAIDRDSAGANVERAREEIAAGEQLLAVRRLIAVRDILGITPEERRAAEDLLRTTVVGMLDASRADDDGLEDLERLYELELPSTLRATAGIYAAERLFAEGHPVKAWKRIREVDRKLPDHGARTLAGEVLGTIGLWLIQSDESYYLLFDYRERGVSALEYLILQYPLSSACSQAYVELSRRYEEDDDLDYAIERLEDLLLYHPGSEFATAAEARLPYLRMERLSRDDYDRSQLLQAAAEVDRWLARYPGHELEPWVLELFRESRRRLAESDLGLARYYRRIDHPFGVRIHATRALALAEAGEVESAVAEARALLAELPVEEQPPAVELLGEGRP